MLIAAPVLIFFAIGTQAIGTEMPADVTLGGQVVLRLRASAGGLTPQERVALITDRLTEVLSASTILPSDVAVYTPLGKPPVIYALGRRLITVDSATVAAAGGENSLKVAVLWAKRLQQVLPRVNIRLSNQLEPKIPAHPPLLITDDLSKVGGNIGNAVFRDKVVIRLRGLQEGGLTAAERADLVSHRLDRIANTLDPNDPDPVKIVPAQLPPTPTAASADNPAHPKSRHYRHRSKHKDPDRSASLTPTPLAPIDGAQILLGGVPVLTVGPREAAASSAASPMALAQSWAHNIRLALATPPEPPLVPIPANQAPNSPVTPAPPPTVSPGSAPPPQPSPAQTPEPAPTPPPAATAPLSPSTEPKNHD